MAGRGSAGRDGGGRCRSASPASGAYSMARRVLDAHCRYDRPLDTPVAMQRFVQAALEHMDADDTHVLSALGSPTQLRLPASG